MAPRRDSASAATVREIAAFRAALRSFLRRSEETARACGLTPQRYLLLLMIKGSPDRSERATVSDLVDRMELAQSTITELVNRAEEAGLVEREGSEVDGRVVHLTLSADGERKLMQVIRATEDERLALRRVLAAFDRSRRR